LSLCLIFIFLAITVELAAAALILVPPFVKMKCQLAANQLRIQMSRWSRGTKKNRRTPPTPLVL
jgi:hypothetical protein